MKILINQHELIELMDAGIHPDRIKSEYSVIASQKINMSWSLGGITLLQSIMKNDVLMASHIMLQHSGMDMVTVTAYMQHHWHMWREHYTRLIKDTIG